MTLGSGALPRPLVIVDSAKRLGRLGDAEPQRNASVSRENDLSPCVSVRSRALLSLWIRSFGNSGVCDLQGTDTTPSSTIDAFFGGSGGSVLDGSGDLSLGSVPTAAEYRVAFTVL
jgi:hypothetical protein